MNIQTYRKQMDKIIPSPELLQTTKINMKAKLAKASTAGTSTNKIKLIYRPKLAAAVMIAMLIITISTVALAATGVFTVYVEPPPFTGEYGDANIMAEHAYARGIYNESGGASRPYYTREQLAQHFIDTAGQEYYASVRQPHIQPEPLNELYSLCNNTVFAIIDGQRVCYSCGYVFTQQQNIDIGWEGEE